MKQFYWHYKKSLKIQKWYSKSVNRRTDNTMAKNRKDKRTNNDLQNTTQKVTDRTTRALLKTDIIHLVINPIQV
jgi:hypothetical protein